MSYLVAAYGVTVVALVGYGLALVRERSRRRSGGVGADERARVGHATPPAGRG